MATDEIIKLAREADPFGEPEKRLGLGGLSMKFGPGYLDGGKRRLTTAMPEILLLVVHEG